MSKRDYYEVLGVEKGADQKEIKKAFKYTNLLLREDFQLLREMRKEEKEKAKKEEKRENEQQEKLQRFKDQEEKEQQKRVAEFQYRLKTEKINESSNARE